MTLISLMGLIAGLSLLTIGGIGIVFIFCHISLMPKRIEKQRDELKEIVLFVSIIGGFSIMATILATLQLLPYFI